MRCGGAYLQLMHIELIAIDLINANGSSQDETKPTDPLQKPHELPGDLLQRMPLHAFDTIINFFRIQGPPLVLRTASLGTRLMVVPMVTYVPAAPLLTINSLGTSCISWVPRLLSVNDRTRISGYYIKNDIRIISELSIPMTNT